MLTLQNEYVGDVVATGASNSVMSDLTAEGDKWILKADGFYKEIAGSNIPARREQKSITPVPLLPNRRARRERKKNAQRNPSEMLVHEALRKLTWIVDRAWVFYAGTLALRTLVSLGCEELVLSDSKWVEDYKDALEPGHAFCFSQLLSPSDAKAGLRRDREDRKDEPLNTKESLKHAEKELHEGLAKFLQEFIARLDVAIKRGFRSAKPMLLSAQRLQSSIQAEVDARDSRERAKACLAKLKPMLGA